MGKVILYGDKMTEAMFHLVSTTKKRRKLQKNFNAENNIQPKTILKSVDEIMFSTTVADSQKDRQDNVEFSIDKLELQREDKIELVSSLKKAMATYAEELDFEKAAKIRDEIIEIESTL